MASKTKDKAAGVESPVMKRLDVEQVKKLAEAGRSVTEIAETLKSTYHTVYQFTQRHRIPTVASATEVGRQKKLSRSQIEEIVRRATKEKYVALATEYGVSLGTIQWHIRQAKRKSTSDKGAAENSDQQIRSAIARLTRKLGTTTESLVNRVVELYPRA